MIKENVEELGFYRCEYCGRSFPERLIKKSQRKNKSITCELCGEKNDFRDKKISELNDKERDYVINLTKKKDKNAELNKAVNYQIRFFILRHIYEILKNSNYNTDLRKNQNELTLNQVNYFADILRNIIVNEEIREEWLIYLGKVRRIDVENEYKILQSWLKNKKIYRKKYLSLFRKAIEFIFELIISKQKISELREFKYEVAEDLKKYYGFTANLKHFEIELMIFTSRHIYEVIKSPDFALKMGGIQDNLTASQIDKLAHAIRKSIIHYQMKTEWLDEFKKRDRKDFMNKYEKLQIILKSDQIYSESFLDCIKKLIKFINGLIKAEKKISELKGIKSIIANDLINGTPLQINIGSNPIFRRNLSIVLSRIIYLIIKVLESNRELGKN